MNKSLKPLYLVTKKLYLAEQRGLYANFGNLKKSEDLIKIAPRYTKVFKDYEILKCIGKYLFKIFGKGNRLPKSVGDLNKSLKSNADARLRYIIGMCILSGNRVGYATVSDFFRDFHTYLYKKPRWYFLPTCRSKYSALRMLRARFSQPFPVDRKKIVESYWRTLYVRRLCSIVVKSTCYFVTMLVAISSFYLFSEVLKTLDLDNDRDIFITTPNLEEKTLVEAYDFLKNAKYNSLYLEIEYVEHNHIAEGVVIRQSPAKGTVIQKWDKVLVLVSAGPRVVTIPEFKGFSLFDTLSELKKVGVLVNSSYIYHVESEELQTGQVLYTYPAAGSLVTSKTPVYVVVSVNNLEEVQMPSLLGKTEEEALRVLEENNLLLGTVYYKPSSRGLNTIIEQSIRSGMTVEPFSSIDIGLSSGYIPDNGTDEQVNGVTEESIILDSIQPESTNSDGANIKLLTISIPDTTAQSKVKVLLGSVLLHNIEVPIGTSVIYLSVSGIGMQTYTVWVNETSYSVSVDFRF